MRIDKKLTDALPKGVVSMLMQLPALKDIRKRFLADLGIPEEVIGHIALVPQFDTRDDLSNQTSRMSVSLVHSWPPHSLQTYPSGRSSLASRVYQASADSFSKTSATRLMITGSATGSLHFAQ